MVHKAVLAPAHRGRDGLVKREASPKVTQHSKARPGAPPRAFSLVELVLVLAIAATLYAMAAPRYASATANYRAQAAARRIAADLALARTAAYNTSQPKTVSFDLQANTITISGLGGLDNSSQQYATDLAAEPYRASLISADFGGQGEVVFDMYGMAGSAGMVIVESGGTRHTVVLDSASGEATVQ